MTKFALTLSFIILFIFNSMNGYAVQDSLFLYTKPGCSNCHDTKQILNESGISFIEKSLDKDINAAEMLRKLALIGYHKEIYLPVIFLNHQLLHPAYQKEKKLVNVPLQNVVDSIRKKFYRGDLHLAVDKQTIAGAANNSQASSDCEVKAPSIYIICDSYTSETDAKTAMNKLISKGYSFAGMIFYENKYMVFSKFYSDNVQANSDLSDIKKQYKNAFLFNMPE